MMVGFNWEIKEAEKGFEKYVLGQDRGMKF